MQDHLVGYGVLILFYGALLYWLYRLVRRHIHPSRSLALGYLASLAVIVAFLMATTFSVMLIAAVTDNMHNPNKILVAAGVGAIFWSAAAGWQFCRSWLRRPRSLS